MDRDVLSLGCPCFQSQILGLDGKSLGLSMTVRDRVLECS